MGDQAVESLDRENIVYVPECIVNGVAPAVSGSSSSSKDRVVEHDGMPWYGVLMLVVSVVVLMLLAGLAYWKRTQRQMRDQVRGILAEYMPMEDLGEALNPMQTEPDAAPVFSVNA